MMTIYKKPLANIAVTLRERQTVGLIFTLVTAALFGRGQPRPCGGAAS